MLVLERRPFMPRAGSSCRCFTLIEILIVVAIIAILAAIAIPNFLEAQTRAKVSRAKADMRSIQTALEVYRVDSNNYPPCYVFPSAMELSPLTTPVAYISSVPREPFTPHNAVGVPFEEPVYDFVRYRHDTANWILHVDDTRSVELPYFLVSVGPDSMQEHHYIFHALHDFSFVSNSYDPTNGTLSRGDIFLFGGGGRLE